MAQRDNHYEAAFEAYLRERKVAYVAVDEARRALVSDQSLKSLDFIVASSRGGSWLVDVKGRRFPSGEQKHYWRNWSTRDDLRSLSAWEGLFGETFGGMFVFAYNIVGDRAPLAERQLFEFRGALYGFVGIRLTDYAALARPISPAWDTVAMPTAAFRQRATAFEAFL